MAHEDEYQHQLLGIIPVLIVSFIAQQTTRRDYWPFQLSIAGQ